jgi:hypothetical protein
MMAHKSRRAILVYAMLAVRTIALGTPTALAANAVHVPSKYMLRSGAQIRQVDCTSAPRAAQLPEHAHDPFASMLLGRQARQAWRPQDAHQAAEQADSIVR